MAFNSDKLHDWKQAFDADFLLASFSATLILLTSLLYSNQLVFQSAINPAYLVQVADDSDSYTTNVYTICSDEVIEVIPIVNPTIDWENELELINKLNPPLIVDNSELINNINSELNTSINSSEKYILNKSLSSVQNSRTFLSPTVATPRPATIRNTTYYSATNYTTHTTTAAPQNKTFIKSEKVINNKLNKSNNIDLDNLSDVSFLLNDLIKSADRQGKNIILSFGAKWCLPCKQMDKAVYTDESIKSFINDEYIFQKLEEKDFETITLKNLYNVKTYPTTLIVDAKGNVIQRYEESISQSRMMNILAANTTAPNHREKIAILEDDNVPDEIDLAIDFLVNRSEYNLDFD